MWDQNDFNEIYSLCNDIPTEVLIENFPYSIEYLFTADINVKVSNNVLEESFQEKYGEGLGTKRGSNDSNRIQEKRRKNSMNDIIETKHSNMSFSKSPQVDDDDGYDTESRTSISFDDTNTQKTHYSSNPSYISNHDTLDESYIQYINVKTCVKTTTETVSDVTVSNTTTVNKRGRRRKLLKDYANPSDPNLSEKQKKRLKNSISSNKSRQKAVEREKQEEEDFNNSELKIKQLEKELQILINNEAILKRILQSKTSQIETI